MVVHAVRLSDHAALVLEVAAPSVEGPGESQQGAVVGAAADPLDVQALILHFGDGKWRGAEFEAAVVEPKLAEFV